MASFTLRIAVVLSTISVVLACHYATDMSRPLPSNHPTINRRLDSGSNAPDAIVPDIAGGRFPIPGGGITVPRPGYGAKTTADLIDQIAKESVANGTGPLCYWSWQSLPPPRGFGDGDKDSWGTRGSYNFSAMEQQHSGSVEAIRDLCTFAVARLQAHVVASTPNQGINVFAGVSEGTEFASYLCRNGLHRDKEQYPERCAPGAPIYTQSWGLRWPMSVTVWKFDGENGDNVTEIMTDWRQNHDMHWLNIMSPGPAPTAGDSTIPTGGVVPHAGTAWGEGGGVVGKALPCDAIPEEFKYQKPFPQDTSPLHGSNRTSKTYLDMGLEYWSNTPGVPLPESKCTRAMKDKCAAAKAKSVSACEACGIEHALALLAAGCNLRVDGDFYCSRM